MSDTMITVAVGVLIILAYRVGYIMGRRTVLITFDSGKE
jgi:hypothetical protein